VLGAYRGQGSKTSVATIASSRYAVAVTTNPRRYDVKISPAQLRMLTKTADGRSCDHRVIAQQIGIMNLLAISGGKTFPIYSTDRDDVVGLRLPIDGTRRVDVILDWSDTYSVRRIRTIASGARRGSDVVEFEQSDVFADEVGQVAYSASCWK